MEGIGSEVSHKIRAAIKAKLVELGAYIDNELPDYIMIMVANKRTRQQMDDDLQLFLGSNTKIFTSWLYTVLQRLQEVTVANFDPEGQKSKGEKRKRSNSEESATKESKSPDEQNKMGKKHMKKAKDERKLKKSKYKAKEKEKDKNQEEKQESTESVGNEKQNKPGGDNGTESSHAEPADSPGDKSQDKVKGKGEQNSNDSSAPKVPEKVNNSNAELEVTSAKSSSPSHYSNEPVKHTFENDPEEEDASAEGDDLEETEDEFNIEPLDKTEDQSTNEKSDDNAKVSKSESQSTPPGMTIKAPTRELLKEHNKIIRESERNLLKAQKKSDTKSNASAEPEEAEKPAEKRPKRILSVSEMLSRNKSLTSEVPFWQTGPRSREDAYFSSHRAKRISQRRDHDVEEDENIYNRDGSSSHAFWERNYYSPRDRNESDNSRSAIPSTSEQKSTIISISKSLEMEKNLGGVKGQEYKKKSATKTTSSPKKKPVSSRIFTIPEPEEPEIPSVIKVKPREFVPKDKQANKALILKAVADAEKSIATVHTRNETDIEPKKSEALYTKNLRGKGKRYEKLAVTLSNVQAGGSIADRVKSKRVVSMDSKKGKARNRKTGSLKDSEQSQGYKSVPELTLKNISNKSEDQFISSKTSAMEKNEKYIHCWLEGVEKAVKDDEIVNPSEIDDFQNFHITFSDEERHHYETTSSSDEDTQSERPENDEDSLTNENFDDKLSTSTKGNEDDGPQIVVTLDRLTPKNIKDIMLRNRDVLNGPLMGSTSNKPDLIIESDDEEMEERSGFRYKEVDSSKEAGTSKQSGSGTTDKANKLEKISERFGRINKTSENHEFKEKYYEFERERYEKKCLKYQGTDKEKHYEKLKDKYASPRQSKNKKLIARLSEKFGKVDREFDDKKKKYSDDDLRYSYYKRGERAAERDAKSSKRDKNSVRSEKPK